MDVVTVAQMADLLVALSAVLTAAKTVARTVALKVVQMADSSVVLLEIQMVGLLEMWARKRVNCWGD